MASIIKWPEIEGFHNIRKLISAYPELLGSNPIVTYYGKVKLHGSNAAVQVLKDGLVIQSRTAVISTSNDNAGFANFVESNRECWLKNYHGKEFVVFGEIVGPGIQKGVAVNKIPNKVFAVFAVQIIGEEDNLISDPIMIKEFVKDIPNVYVLPWLQINSEERNKVSVNWLGPAEDLQHIVDGINVLVDVVEKCDPWVKEIFGIEGVGEGIVFYPVGDHSGRKAFGDLCFKAKGEKHKVVNAKPAQVDPEKAANAEAFAALVLTEARLEQGVRAISGGELTFDNVNVGKFIGWVNQDVAKETKAELEASGLEWKQVSKTVTDKARNWYLEKYKKYLLNTISVDPIC